MVVTGFNTETIYEDIIILQGGVGWIEGEIGNNGYGLQTQNMKLDNYPNPFYHSTVIAYQLKSKTIIKSGKIIKL